MSSTGKKKRALIMPQISESQRRPGNVGPSPSPESYARWIA